MRPCLACCYPLSRLFDAPRRPALTPPPSRLVALAAALIAFAPASGRDAPLPADLAPYFHPPELLASQFDERRPPLLRADGSRITQAAQWAQRRAEIRREWFDLLGPWPDLLPAPGLETLRSEPRDNFIQHAIRIEVSAGAFQDGYLLVPHGRGPFPAVFVPFYDPETSAGLGGRPLRDFAYQLARRGFVALCIGSPGGDAREPALNGATCQPLAYLAYIAANCHTALARLPEVDPRRIGVAGHSYGGKWALFASCLYDKFACAAWSDPGIVFDETRASINYWEPWYLGLDPALTRKRGLITSDSPRTGAYRTMIAQGRDLQELHALMAPRPFLVSGGAEDPVKRWLTLNHAVTVNRLLGYEHRVAMHNRPAHDPTPESNEVIYRFFEHFLGPVSSF